MPLKIIIDEQPSKTERTLLSFTGWCTYEKHSTTRSKKILHDVMGRSPDQCGAGEVCTCATLCGRPDAWPRISNRKLHKSNLSLGSSFLARHAWIVQYPKFMHTNIQASNFLGIYLPNGIILPTLIFSWWLLARSAVLSSKIVANALGVWHTHFNQISRSPALSWNLMHSANYHDNSQKLTHWAKSTVMCILQFALRKEEQIFHPDDFVFQFNHSTLHNVCCNRAST